MKLLEVITIREAYGYDAIDDVINAINSELEAASPSLESMLRTKFAETALSEEFFVQLSQNYTGGNSHTEFRMSRGFVQASPAYTITCGSTRLELDESTAVNLRATAGYDYSNIDLERGMVSIDGYDLGGKYVRITATAGFDEDSGDEEVYDQTTVPAWLKEAAKLHAMIGLTSNPAMDVNKGDDAGGEISVDTRKSILNSIIEDHTRYAPLARKPL